MKKPVKVFLKVFLSIILIFVIFITGCSIAMFSGCVGNLDELHLEEVDLSLNLSSYVYSLDPETGEYVEYERIYGENNRVWADLENIPVHVRNAAIAIEDERFYDHSGVDILSTLKATAGYVLNKSTARGGSTITQQLVKNLTGDSEKKVTRKIQEMARSIQLEKKMSKDEILELYLNTIYLSQGCNGIQSAAKFYFGKNVSDLTIAEGACLVGITQYPSLYDPLINPDKNKEKQELVLSKMFELGFISETEYDEAVAQELIFVGDKNSTASSQSYFVDQIIEEVLHDLQTEYGYTEAVAANLLYNGGLKIYSTVDPDIQKIAENVFSNPNNLAAGPNGTPQASMCVMDPYTGEVKAIIGGFGEKEGSRTKRRATDSVNFARQPGSTIKPIAVYAPALENGLIKPGTIFEDKPITVGDWSPKNYYKGFKGKVTVKYAIDISINTVPIQILQQLGVDSSYNFLSKKLGVTSLVSSDKNLPALALGGLTNGVSNMELTAAYCTFVNDGEYNKPITYTKVVNSDGDVILENKTKSTVAMTQSTARTMNGLLKSVCDTGTGTSARFGSYTIAGKTGTTDNDRDRWFVGYTPYYCAAVWVGYDTNETLSFYGSNPTIPLWKKVMEETHRVKNLPSKSFNYTYISVVEPSTSLENLICTESGLKATEQCPAELLSQGEPTEDKLCDIHGEPEETTEEVDSENPEIKNENINDNPYLSDTGL